MVRGSSLKNAITRRPVSRLDIIPMRGINESANAVKIVTRLDRPVHEDAECVSTWRECA